MFILKSFSKNRQRSKDETSKIFTVVFKQYLICSVGFFKELWQSDHTVLDVSHQDISNPMKVITINFLYLSADGYVLADPEQWQTKRVNVTDLRVCTFWSGTSWVQITVSPINIYLDILSDHGIRFAIQLEAPFSPIFVLRSVRAVITL